MKSPTFKLFKKKLKHIFGLIWNVFRMILAVHIEYATNSINKICENVQSKPSTTAAVQMQ